MERLGGSAMVVDCFVGEERRKRPTDRKWLQGDKKPDCV